MNVKPTTMCIVDYLAPKFELVARNNNIVLQSDIDGDFIYFTFKCMPFKKDILLKDWNKLLDQYCPFYHSANNIHHTRYSNVT